MSTYIYRCTPQAFLENYSGRGASYQNGGRWNMANQPALYFALQPATALLEMAQYLPSPQLVPKTYRLAQYRLPKTVKIQTLSRDDLPKNWRDYPHPRETQAIGSEFLNEAKHLALQVPSAAVPAQLAWNILLNPLHPDIDKITLSESFEDLYSTRTFAGL